ncbi:hypothetical protein FALCPG4_010016 [Fusarium falciforme]
MTKFLRVPTASGLILLALLKIPLPSASYLETTSRLWRSASSFSSASCNNRAKSASRKPPPDYNRLVLATSTT